MTQFDLGHLPFIIVSVAIISSLVVALVYSLDRMALKSRSENRSSLLNHFVKFETGSLLSPNPLWATSDSGELLWSNKSFDTLAADFDVTALQACPSALTETQRVLVDSSCEGTSRWFDVDQRRVDDWNLFYAVDVTSVINAQRAQKEFIQTITKTFAQLPIGLAVFDKNLKLALFNPALIDLSDLSAEVLTNRPDLFEIFDLLRSNRVLPEPKDYNSWRSKIQAVLNSATHGQYVETWSLPQDRTLRVTGKPFPDGAVAFLFEDVSDEVLLTRQVRTDLGLRQAALDHLGHAIALISPSGKLAYTNSLCRELLQLSSDTELEVPREQFMLACRTNFPQQDVWARLELKISGLEGRVGWSTSVSTSDGQLFILKLTFIGGGSTMITLDKATDLYVKAPERLRA